MCGINGIYDFARKHNKSELEALVHDMNERIIHRGPDSEGLFAMDGFAMGMRRLSIVDLAGGSQPIYSKDGRYVIVYNGELYNTKALRERLISEGMSFSTTTDTEVVVQAFSKYGTKSFDMLDGMYAFSIMDRESGELYLVRDRIGEKPLYFYKADEVLLWASELKSLAGTGLFEKKIDKTALNLYLQLTYIPAPFSIYERVKKLLPGHFLKVLESGEMEDVCYWDLTKIPEDKGITYDEAVAKLRELLLRSVDERRIADVPLGAFLSGGVDSSAVVAALAKVSPDPIATFTMGFSEKAWDERDRAILMAKKYSTDHHEYVLKPQDILEELDRIVDTVDEPFGDSSMLPTWFLSRFAKENVTAVLTGDAGDELFLGYAKYLIGYYADKFNSLPGIARGAVRLAAKILPDKSVFSRKVNKVLRCVDEPIEAQRIELMSLGLKEKERKTVLKTDWYDEGAMDIVSDRYHVLPESEEWRRTQYTDIKTVLEGDMLVKVDRMSMLHSLETRTPLLSRDIVEFAFSLPAEYKLQGKNSKRIMKDAFEEWLPENYANLPKSGFGVPLEDWFRDELKDLLQKELSEETIRQQGIFDYKEVKNLIDEHMSGKRNRKSELWTLLVFERWYRNNIA